MNKIYLFIQTWEYKNDGVVQNNTGTCFASNKQSYGRNYRSAVFACGYIFLK